MKIVQLTGSTGAQIEDVDIESLSEQDVATIRSAVVNNGVVVIRNQVVSPEAHIAFGKRFGNIVHTEGAVNHGVANKNNTLEGYPEIFRVTNAGKGPNTTEQWHSDNAHVPRPTGISILVAQTIPPFGGDTLFANQYVAYDTLSDGYKRLLRHLRLKHSGASQVAYRYGNADKAPFEYHPIVRTHEETGRRALFIGGRQGVARPHFEGMTPEESYPIQQYLYEHATQPDRCYRHMWKQGDVVMWDNRCTLHFAVHDYGTAVRNMNRITIEGGIPFEEPYEDGVRHAEAVSGAGIDV
ncbi:MAG: TauD/TfdA dioxygenase family protein [Lautropia sp.]